MKGLKLTLQGGISLKKRYETRLSIAGTPHAVQSWIVECVELQFLDSDLVPRRVPDHGVEAGVSLGASVEYFGELQRPVEEGALLGLRDGVVQ